MRLFNLCIARAKAAGRNPVYIARLALVAAAYIAAAMLARPLVLPVSMATPLWPSSALALCACIAWGMQVAPAVWLGAGITALHFGFTPMAAAVTGFGNAAEAAVAAWFAGRIFACHADVAYPERVFRFIPAAIASSAIAATIGSGMLAAAGTGSSAGIVFDWLTWCAGDAGAMIIAAPLLLSWSVKGDTVWSRPRIVEAAMLAITTAAVSWAVFGGPLGSMPLVYLTFCPVLWAAFRFPLPAATWTAGVICAVAAWGTAHMQGPFALPDLKTDLFLLMTFTGVLGTTSLVLAGLVHQRHEAANRLAAERALLEQRLQERTESLVKDIERRKQAEAAMREAETRYRTLVEMSPDAILVQQADRFVFANGAACTLLQAPGTEAIVGKSLYDFVHPDVRDAMRGRLARLVEGEAGSAVEEKLMRLDGSSIDAEINAAPLTHNGKPAALFIARDVTERRKSTEQMAYLAHYDALTGLPNRVLFHQRLEHALSLAERPGKSVEILFLDLDRFKNINDTLGHAAGDLVLQEAARRLQGILRESDTVARLGGDEFVVLVENIDEPHRGGVIAEKILAAFKPPFMQDKEPLAVSTSIGIASYPTDGVDAEALLKNADIAMYRAKEMGRHTYCYYSPELNRHTTERLALEYALGAALERGELSLYYQPRIDVLSNRITGMEALLRWWHPTLGPIPPDRFIPIAEETGLIVPIGYWTLRTACMQNRAWQDSSAARLRVSVNLSQRQLTDRSLLDNIRAILDDTGLEPRFLEIEITEGTIMSDPDRIADIVNTLDEMGVSLSIDDFGTGYSSLAHLKQFPIRAVKIDRSFVQGLPSDRGDSAITRAIISLAHTLECSVVAEGTETQQQYEFLREHECDSVQGYYFSAPMAADIFGDLLKTQASLHIH